jgi:hypothetical protein
MKVLEASLQQIFDFLVSEFQPVKDSEDLNPLKSKYMELYANLAKILSDRASFAECAKILSESMSGCYQKLKKELQVKGAFSVILGEYASVFGFSEHVYILNNGIAPQVFASVIRDKKLFRDLLSRPHGEYTHAVQWLTLGLVLDHNGYGHCVADLYRDTVRFISTRKFQTKDGMERVTLWRWLVDCFPEKEYGVEDYEKNIFCDTYRCPQVMTSNLTVTTTKSWLGEFLLTRRNKGIKGDVKGAREDGHYRSDHFVHMSKKEQLERKVPVGNDNEMMDVYEVDYKDPVKRNYSNRILYKQVIESAIKNIKGKKLTAVGSTSHQ